MSDLHIDPLGVKAEMLIRAASDREHALAEAADATDRIKAKAIARVAFEERRDAILRNLSQAQILDVSRRAFGAKYSAFTGGGES